MRSNLGLIAGFVPALLLACTGKVDDGSRGAVDLNGDGIPDAPRADRRKQHRRQRT